MDEFSSFIRRNAGDPEVTKKLIRFLDALGRGGSFTEAAAAAGLDSAVASDFLRSLKDELRKRTPVRRKAALGGSGRVVAYADGASRGNPGEAACAAILAEEGGEELLRRAKRIGKTTNNVAEYEGVILALELSAELGVRNLTIKLDSELVVRQMNGEYKVKHPSLIPLHEKARSLSAAFESVIVLQVPRAETKAVDKLANQALDGKFDEGAP